MRIAAIGFVRWAPLGLALALLVAAGGASRAAAASGGSLARSAPGAWTTAEGAGHRLRGGLVAAGTGALGGGGYRASLGGRPGLYADRPAEPTAVPSTPSPGEGIYMPLVRRGG